MRRTRLLQALLLALVPALALASGGEAAAHASNPWVDIALKFVNFLGLLAIFYFSLRKLVPQALKDRKEKIERDLIEAREAQAAAEAMLADYQKRVANLETEIQALKDNFKSEGEAQKRRLVEEAHAAAEALKKNAVAAGDREARRVIDELKEDAVRQALALAEETLRKAYAADDQQKALSQTISKIEGMH